MKKIEKKLGGSFEGGTHLKIPSFLKRDATLRASNPHKSGFGIAGSARVGGSARRPSPPPGCRPWVLGSDFFEKISPKNGVLGGCLCRENRLFWEVVVEKMDCDGDKMKTIAVLSLQPCGALPICALQRARTQSATPKFPAMPNRQ